MITAAPCTKCGATIERVTVFPPQTFRWVCWDCKARNQKRINTVKKEKAPKNTELILRIKRYENKVAELKERLANSQ